MRGVCINTVGTVMIKKQKHFTVNIVKVVNKSIKGAPRKHRIRPAAQSDKKTKTVVKRWEKCIH